MSRIRILDEKLINKIAAGEVVERPASVVKELLENAIDADSTRIEVEIKGGGIELIRVSDNGTGLQEDEIVLAFTRHATSKLSQEEDLWSLTSMGFRGEALPSIASVAKVEMITNTGSGGFSQVVEGGKFKPLKPAAATKGTTVIVKDLFYNTPARRKFLKTPVTEGNKVYDVVARIALSCTETSISFINESRLVFKTSGDGDLRAAAKIIYGADYADHMLSFAQTSEQVSVSGLTGKPDFGRPNRKSQVFYVNRRHVKSPLLSAALEEAYRGFLLHQEKPAALIFINIFPAMVDVNVHPQKSEVRFKDEQAVFNAVKRSVREALYKSMGYSPQQIAASLDEKQWQEPVSPAYGPYLSHEPGKQHQLPFACQQSSGVPFRLLGQWQDSYFICEIDGNLEIIDQHAAHERLLYNKLLSQEKQVISQELAVAVVLELNSNQLNLIERHQDILTSLGYTVEPWGDRSAVIRAVPSIAAGNEVETLLDILEGLEDHTEKDNPFNRGLKVMACRGAVKAGESLTMTEMTRLIEDWLETTDRHRCPHGRPTVMTISPNEIERYLKR